MAKEDIEKVETNDEGDMPFLDHLEEMRKTIIRCLIALVLACVVVGIFLVPFNDFLMYPFLEAKRNFNGEVPNPRVSSAMAPFFVMLEIAIFGGLFIALPFVLYFIGKFVAPAFTKKERKVLLPAVIISASFFVSGAAMAFFGMLPIALEFGFRVCQTYNWDILFDLEKYYSFIVFVPLASGLAFQLPLILFILIYLEVFSTKYLRSNRRLAFVIILIMSAVLTPADPITLFLLAVPLYALYEFAIFFGQRCVDKKILRRKQEEEAFEREGREMDEAYRRSREAKQNKLALATDNKPSENQEEDSSQNDVETDEDLEARYSDTTYNEAPYYSVSATDSSNEKGENYDDNCYVFENDEDAELSLKEIDARMRENNPIKTEDYLTPKNDDTLADGGLEIYQQAQKEYEQSIANDMVISGAEKENREEKDKNLSNQTEFDFARDFSNANEVKNSEKDDLTK